MKIGRIAAITLGFILLGGYGVLRLFAQTQHADVLTWTEAAGTTITGYNVSRGTATGGPYAPLATVTSTSLSGTYSDTAGVAGTTYHYVIQACNGANCSGNSNEVVLTFLGNPPAPTLSGVAQ